MMANISQLRAVLGLGDTNKFYIHLLTLILLSLVSHIFFVFFTVIRSHFKNKHNIVLKRSERGEIKSEIVKRKEKKDEERKKLIDAVNSKKQTEQDNTGSTTHHTGQVNTESIEIRFENMDKEDKQIQFCCCCTKTYRGTEYREGELCQCPNCIINLYLNYVCSFLVLITICANIGITGIGISGDC